MSEEAKKKWSGWHWIHKDHLKSLQARIVELEEEVKSFNRILAGGTELDQEYLRKHKAVQAYQKALSTPAEENKELALEFMKKVHEGWDKADLGGVMTVMELTREYLNAKARGE